MKLSVVVIRPGLTLDKSYHFPASVLERDGQAAFEGRNMYLNHPTFLDRMSGGRDVGSFVGVLKQVRWDAREQAVMATAEIFDADWRDKLNMMADCDALDRMALSIYSDGKTKTREDGVCEIEALHADPLNSLDFVYMANAGGAVVQRLAASPNSSEVSTMTPEQIKAQIDAAIAPIQAQLVDEKKAREAAEVKAAESEKALKIAQSAAALKDKIAASKLPQAAADLIAADFAGKEDLAGLDEKIVQMQKLCEGVGAKPGDTSVKIQTSPTVTGFGAAPATPEDLTAANADLKASYVNQFLRQGLPLADAETKAAKIVNEIAA